MRTTDGGGPGGVGTLPPDAQMPGPPPRDDDDLAWRCGACAIDWPLLQAPDLVGLPPDYEFAMPRDRERFACPVCEGELHFSVNINPIPVEEARSLKNHADFERYYEATRGP